MSQKRVYLFGNGKAEGNAKMRRNSVVRVLTLPK